MNKDQTIKSFLTFIKSNGFQDDVRICLSDKRVKIPNQLIFSVLKLLEEWDVKEEILYSLKIETLARQKLPFELHYTDGYRSWYRDVRVCPADAFYWDGWLVSLYSIEKNCPYIEALSRAGNHYFNGQKAQLLPRSFYETCIFPNYSVVNDFLEDVRGKSFLGCDWCQEDDGAFAYARFESQEIVSTNPRDNYLSGRPAVKL